MGQGEASICVALGASASPFHDKPTAGREPQTLQGSPTSAP